MTDDSTATQAKQVARLLFLHAQTSLHPGSGTALGVVDLPVQRERHTQWPTIPGSTLKGILRDACRQKVEGKRGRDADATEEIVTAFGPPTAEAEKHAGALSVTDARILAFPVRSLRGIFAWVTCAAVLERLHRDMGLAGFAGLPLEHSPARDTALCAERSPLLVDGKSLVLEEFEFERAGHANEIAAWVAASAIGDERTRIRLQNHLVILHDDDFTHFVRHATEIIARIGLDYERKTVRQGALFYQECLPAETLFYAIVFANSSRRDNQRTASDLMRYLQKSLPGVLQIGGDETTGKGLCSVKLSNSDGGVS